MFAQLPTVMDRFYMHRKASTCSTNSREFIILMCWEERLSTDTNFPGCLLLYHPKFTVMGDLWQKFKESMTRGSIFVDSVTK